MPQVLFLCHRIPYPPNKGDKIASWQVMKALCGRATVHLGTFIDDPADSEHRARMEAMTGESCILDLKPLPRLLRAARGLLSGEALSVAMLRDARMQRWVDDLLSRHRIDHVVAFSSQMAPYVMHHTRGRRSVMDFCDVDSEKWRAYAADKAFPKSWVYAREGRALGHLERRAAAAFDASCFVTEPEAALFRQLYPELADRAHCIPNGVDHAYFDPAAYFAPVPLDGAPRLVFTGAMDYWANVDAVVWFCAEVWPLLRARHPQASFTIVGGKPTAEVQALASRPGVNVTGRVADVRPYVQAADVVVAPLRIARGVQNKVLEGMAMARPVVATSGAFTGIEATPGSHMLVADTAQDYLAAIERFLAAPDYAAACGRAARAVVLERYDWTGSMNRLLCLAGLDPASAPAPADRELIHAARH